MKNKNVLVTGGAGYIGSECVHQLVNRGFNVTVFDNLEYGFKSNVPENCRLIVGDLRDYKQIFDAVDIVNPDAVMHFAAYALVGESIADPLKYYYNNVTGGIHLLQAMEKQGCKRLIFSSTCATYGIHDIPIDEQCEQKPINPYGMSKLIFERIIKQYSELKGLNYTIFRYFNAAGSDIKNGLRERHIPETHIIPNIVKSIRTHQRFTVFGGDYKTADGTCVRDYIHIKDIASAHVKALSDGVCGEFNLGTGVGISNLELVNKISTLSKTGLNYSIGERRPGDPDYLIANPTKANSMLGWIPAYSDIDTILSDALR